MSFSTRFSVATHILTLLASEPGKLVSSEYIAGSVNTNPVVIRKLLGLLKAARLVRAHGGPGGGWELLPPARLITLRDVLRAVEGSTLFPPAASIPNPKCPVGRRIRSVLGNHLEATQSVMEESLANTTIASLDEEMKSS